MKIEFSTNLHHVEVPQFNFREGWDGQIEIEEDEESRVRLSITLNLKGDLRQDIIRRIGNQLNRRPIEVLWISEDLTRIDIRIFDHELDDPNIEPELTALVCEKIVDVLGPRTRLSRILFMPL